LAIGAEWVPPLAAQTRTATIQVSVMVQDPAAGAVMGADAIATPRAMAGVAFEGDAWRVTAGGSPEVRVQVEDGHPSPYVVICRFVDGVASQCRRDRHPGTRVAGRAGADGLVVRPRSGSAAPSRLTVTSLTS
jgi:hypothetical protein